MPAHAPRWSLLGVFCATVATWLATACAGSSPQTADRPTPPDDPVESIRAWLAAPPPGRGEAPAIALDRTQANAVAAMVIAARRDEVARARAAELDARSITLGARTLRWMETSFGTPPPAGPSLWISLHGGGGAPPEVNDEQWLNQARLYSLEEGIYVAPRAPTDTWNLWHEAHIDGLLGRLIEGLVAVRGVDPARVYLLGYSAGGDGVWQLAPRLADRFAAAAMMAGHPNEASLLGLRNLPFAILVGGDDDAYQRNHVARDRAEQLAALHAADPRGYASFVRIYEGLGHWMLRRDAEALPWLASHARVSWPRKVVWYQDDVLHDDAYWLARPPGEAHAGERVDAEVEGQLIRVTTHGTPLRALDLDLADDLVNLDGPVRVEVDGAAVFEGTVPRTARAIWNAQARRFDPGRVPTARLSLRW